jgi:ABC-type cobalamin/Fe3+-siderophores transport system ATPase subunit
VKSAIQELPGTLFIQRITVEKLFGRYSYDLQLQASAVKGPTRLIILYGDNGSGKTTILRLIFNLLAHGQKAGHRRYISKTVFRLLRVVLGDKIAITADRTGDSLSGAFRISIHEGDDLVARAEWVPDEKGGVHATKQSREEGTKILSFLSGLNLGLYFLSDDRKIRSNQYLQKDEVESDEITDEEFILRQELSQHYYVSARPRRLQEENATTPLRTALERASGWATQQVLRGSSKGEQDANAIYTDIIARIAGAEKKEPEREGPGKEQIIQDLEKQAERSFNFSRYGLIAPIRVEALTESVRYASTNVFPTIAEVLNPYVDGLKARLNALQPVHDTIDTFCGIVNSFYRDKRLTFALPKGPTVETADGDRLAPGALSSGERQLLLLFCNILVAKDQNSIFIIDEPELSLNVKWQRKLVRTLLDFTRGSYVQFLLASHSIELLASHRDHVVKLTESNER